MLPEGAAREPSVSVTGNIPRYRLRHDLPLSEIRALEREKGYEGAENVLGFTTFEAAQQMESEVRFFGKENENAGCYAPSSVSVSFDITRVEVFVPMEYAEGTCQYREVLAHEEGHVGELGSTHSEFLEQLKDTVRAFVATVMENRGKKAKSANEASAIFSAALRSRLSNLGDAFSDVLRDRQQKLDTPENYAIIGARCPSWEVAPHS